MGNLFQPNGPSWATFRGGRGQIQKWAEQSFHPDKQGALSELKNTFQPGNSTLGRCRRGPEMAASKRGLES